jgi:type VI secretion system protein ImpB
MVLGDFGSTKDRALDLDERELRSIDGNNLSYVMKDMEIETSFEVRNLVNPEEEDEMMGVRIPIEDMQSFSPDAISKAVPKLRALLLLRSALRALQTNVSNSKAFRRQLRDLFLPENAEDLAKVREELKEFTGLRIPAAQNGEIAEA